METAEVLEISRQAIFVLLKASIPLMLVALVVGVIISLFQALTQIQEMTLSFVPKIIAIFLAMIITLPYTLDTLRDFTVELFKRIAGGG
jgi:flagellar biosynthesis protein FliQ